MMQMNMKRYAADVRTAMLTSDGLDRAYWNNAPESKTMPYAVFGIRSIGNNRLNIEVDLWGLKGGETELWDIADSVEANLDGNIISNEYHASEVITNSDKKWVADDDERIIRINLSFTATYQA